MNIQEQVHIWLMFYALLLQLVQFAQAHPHDAMHLPSSYIICEVV